MVLPSPGGRTTSARGAAAAGAATAKEAPTSSTAPSPANRVGLPPRIAPDTVPQRQGPSGRSPSHKVPRSRADTRLVSSRTYHQCAFCGWSREASSTTVLPITTTIAGSFTLAGFYLGFAASIALLAAMYAFARSTVKAARLERSVDAALLLLLVVALSVYFVAIPGFGYGDLVLTLVFVVDLGALVFATVGASMRRTLRHRKLGWGLVAACSAATLGDGFVAATASGGVHTSVHVAALVWAVTGFATAYSAHEA